MNKPIQNIFEEGIILSLDLFDMFLLAAFLLSGITFLYHLVRFFIAPDDYTGKLFLSTILTIVLFLPIIIIGHSNSVDAELKRERNDRNFLTEVRHPLPIPEYTEAQTLENPNHIRMMKYSKIISETEIEVHFHSERPFSVNGYNATRHIRKYASGDTAVFITNRKGMKFEIIKEAEVLASFDEKPKLIVVK